MAKVRADVKSRIHRIMWELGFVAMSVALGEDWATARTCLSDESAARARDLIATLERGDRQKKAEALARELSVIARDIERLETKWRS